MKSIRSMSNMRKAISGNPPPQRERSADEDQRVEDDMRVQSSMSERSIARELAKGDRVSALLSSSAAPRARSNSLNPEHAKGDRVSTLVGSSATPRARFNSLHLGVSESVLAQSARDATGQAQSCSPRAAGGARAFHRSPACIPRASDAPDAAVGAASEEDILRWIDATTGSCEPPPAYPPAAPSPDAFAKSPPTLEAPQGQIDGFFSQLPHICHQDRVASVGD